MCYLHEFCRYWNVWCLAPQRRIWPALLSGSVGHHSCFSGGLTQNNGGGVGVGLCACARTRTSTCEGVYLLWAGLGTAQNRCPGSNPISPQPGKSATAAQWAAARGCGQLDPMPCHFHSFAANSFTSSFVHFWSVRFHMQWSPQSADTVSARTKHKHEKLDFGDLIQHYVTGYPVVVSPLNLKVQLLERSSRPAPRTKAQMEKKWF